MQKTMFFTLLLFCSGEGKSFGMGSQADSNTGKSGGAYSLAREGAGGASSDD
jgi:hypothetical protein